MKMVKESSHLVNNKRRKFLKKTLYTAPTLIALGTLAKPTNLEAGGSTIPGPPGGGRGLAPAGGGGGLGGAGLGP